METIINIDTFIHFNPVLTTVFITWFTAQGLKFLIRAAKGKIDFYNFVTTGGMPSGHSAVVSAVATCVGLLEGFDSPLFGLSIALAIIIMHDAVVIRGAAGKQAKAINMIISDLKEGKKFNLGHFKTHLGHSPIQVFAGSLLGITIAFAVWMYIYV